MRSSRSIRNRGRKRKSQVFDLDITSLLDILVIMLVFLLQSTNSTGIILTVPKDVELPVSSSATPSNEGIVVQVSPTNIWVEDKEVLNMDGDIRSQMDQGGRRLIPLFNELVKRKELIKRSAKSSPQAQDFGGIVNLVVDKTVKYSFVKKLLYTCAEAGFKEYKFVVMGLEQ
ncbi:MAG: hypothetical protein CME71_03160 [Halobacteriovorax sp.]|nr:hypothetical protein [Halobacteriovorax sp.]